MPLATSPSGAVVSLLRSVDGSLPNGRQVALLRLKESEKPIAFKSKAGDERKVFKLFPLLSKLSDLFP